ncbi:MAG: hypothetical protein EBZ81_16290, partial [Betaproteobacteria bacterium]|nr:hypothetical protein [Betaproteobacteria bacterium]
NGHQGNPGPGIEGPVIVRKHGRFYLFVSLADQINYHVVVGRADRITGPYLDRMGKPLLGEGGTPVIAPYGKYRGNGHNGALVDECPWFDIFVNHTLMETSRDLQVRPMFWSQDGWPLVGEVLVSPYREAKPNMVGQWIHRVAWQDAPRVEFQKDGTLRDRRGAQGRWELHGRNLELHWPTGQRRHPAGVDGQRESPAFSSTDPANIRILFIPSDVTVSIRMKETLFFLARRPVQLQIAPVKLPTALGSPPIPQGSVFSKFHSRGILPTHPMNPMACHVRYGLVMGSGENLPHQGPTVLRPKHWSGLEIPTAFHQGVVDENIEPGALIDENPVVAAAPVFSVGCDYRGAAVAHEGFSHPVQIRTGDAVCPPNHHVVVD